MPTPTYNSDVRYSSQALNNSLSHRMNRGISWLNFQVEGVFYCDARGVDFRDIFDVGVGQNGVY